MKKLTTDEFILKAKKIHGDRYDYSKTDYKNNDTRVIIICKEHREFLQIPHNHLNKKTICPKCSREKNTSNTKDFIFKSKRIHKRRYNYSLVKYVNSKEPIKIICKKHGTFSQTPNGHLRGNGCQKCRSEKIHTWCSSNTKEFIKKSKKIHGNKYDYSKVNYHRSRNKINIMCNIHDFNFFPTANNHLKGSGCPLCKGEKTSKIKKNRFISNDTKRKIRESALNRLKKIGVVGKYNPKACKYFNELNKTMGWDLQHALNGGEIKVIGYSLDAYDKERNITVEYDEPHHYRFGNLKSRDVSRQNNIINHIKCKFFRYDEKKNKLYEVN